MTYTLLIILWHTSAAAIQGFSSSAACDYAAATVQRHITPQDITLLACVPSDRVRFVSI